MSEEILIRQGAPTLAGIKTGSLFPCPCDDREALLTDVRRLNRQLVPKGLGPPTRPTFWRRNMAP